MTEELTVDQAFAEAIDHTRHAWATVEALRGMLRYRTLTAKDADRIRRMALVLNTDVETLVQLRGVAADRAQKRGNAGVMETDDPYLEGPTIDLEGLVPINVTFYVEGDDFEHAVAHLTQTLSEAIGPLGPQCGIHVVVVAASADAPAGAIKFSIN